jgi:hypothetical protein
MSKFATHAGWIVGILAVLGSGVAGSLTTLYLQKEDYAIAATSCSQRDPQKAFIEHVETGREVEVPLDKVPIQLYRVTRITNIGKKTISDEDLHILIDNDMDAKIWHTMILYENPLPQHPLFPTDYPNEDGTTFRVRLKNFNPHDTISVIVNSNRQIGITVLGKGAGFTLLSSFKKERCGMFGSIDYSGFLAYTKAGENCAIHSVDHSLACWFPGSYLIVPPGFPTTGRIRTRLR